MLFLRCNNKRGQRCLSENEWRVTGRFLVDEICCAINACAKSAGMKASANLAMQMPRVNRGDQVCWGVVSAACGGL